MTEAASVPNIIAARLKSKHASIRRSALLQIVEAGRKQHPGSSWAVPYVNAGVMETIVEATAATPPRQMHGQVTIYHERDPLMIVRILDWLGCVSPPLVHVLRSPHHFVSVSSVIDDGQRAWSGGRAAGECRYMPPERLCGYF